MGKSITRKLLETHIVEGAWKSGSEIAIRIDQTLTQDATGTMAYLQFEATGLKKITTELSVSYIDHNTIQIGFENADDHKYLHTIAAKYGIVLSRAGNGICHQVRLERFGKPGKTLLGSDSHTPTGGGIGMISIGAGGLDVALAMGGAPFYLVCPKVVKINLTGQLKSTCRNLFRWRPRLTLQGILQLSNLSRAYRLTKCASGHAPTRRSRISPWLHRS